MSQLLFFFFSLLRKPILVCKVCKMMNLKVGPSFKMFPFGLTNNYTKFHSFYFTVTILSFFARFDWTINKQYRNKFFYYSSHVFYYFFISSLIYKHIRKALTYSKKARKLTWYGKN